MPSPATRTTALFLMGSLILSACTADGFVEPGPNQPLATALTSFGDSEAFEAPGVSEVVVVRDRHFTGRGLTYVSEELRTRQREHRRLVDFLVGRGFGLLGCELELGPIPDDAAAADQRAVIERARVDGDDLDRWSLYQPLRYEMDFGPRLVVLGVEDPDLYGRDVRLLDRFLDLTEARRRLDGHADPSDRSLLAGQKKALLAIQRDNAPRGTAAADNLLALMKHTEQHRAILLLGAAHVPAAVEVLRARNIRHYVFGSRTLRAVAP